MSKNIEPLVSVHTYKRYLVITGPVDLEHKDWIPAGNGKIGCVLLHSKKHLEISKEALAVLQKVKRNRDSIGDLMWNKSDEAGWVFAWLGTPRVLKSISEIEDGTLTGDRDFQIPDSEHYILVKNNPPQAACEVIDNHENLL